MKGKETRGMAKGVVITSGKGGVGKPTSSAALGAALAQAGRTVAVVDFDVGLRNLDLVMGAERHVVFDLINVAVQRPTMKFVATKTAEQLDLQALHRVRERLVSQRTGVINQIRAFLPE